MRLYLDNLTDVYVEDLSESDKNYGDTRITIAFDSGDDLVIILHRFYIEDIIPGTFNLVRETENLKKRIEQLENEVNAVEWMNGCIEKELFECRKKS